MADERKTKVIAYVDGFNLYFALREQGWQRFYWLNPWALCESLLIPNQELVAVRYFTARISAPEDKRRRQAAFLHALENTPGVRVTYGRYKFNTVTCRNCQRSESVPTEKRSDVSLAVAMLSDAHNNQFDVALLLSGDTDFCPVVEAIRQNYPTKRVVVCFPPDRQNRELEQVATACLCIGRARISGAQYPDTIAKPNGVTITRPMQWTVAYSAERAAMEEARKKLKGGLDK